MNKSKLMQVIREDFLEHPIPLCDIQKLPASQIPSFANGQKITETWWRQALPEIDPNRVYYTSANFGAIFYYEAENSVLIDMSWLLMEPDMKKAQDEFKTFRESILRAIQEKEYIHAVLQLENATMLHVSRDIILRQPATPELYKFFIDVYTHADSGAALFSEDVIRRLLESKSEEQILATQEELNAFPDEITIYRGEDSASTPSDCAFSWTTSKKIAYQFATYYVGKQYRLITAKVKKADVVERFTERNEEELILLPSTVYDKKTEYLMTAKELFDKKPNPLNTAMEYIDRYRSSPLLNNRLFDHEASHSMRVAILAAYLADHEKVNVYLDKLLISALFHDCGRESDDADNTHGASSYALYKRTYTDDPIVEFLMTFHCRDDEDADMALPACENQQDLWKAYCVLKDADALDRVRLPIYDSTDPAYLHFLYSEKLIAVASELLHSYKI